MKNCFLPVANRFRAANFNTNSPLAPSVVTRRNASRPAGRGFNRSVQRSVKRGDNRGPRRGIAMVWVGMLFPLLVAVLAFTIDLSRLYVARSEAQKAADAAALAGAYQYSNLTGSNADASARAYAAMSENGAYVQGVRNTTVTPVYRPMENGVQQNNWYRVSVSRVEPTFFAGILGNSFRNIVVGAQSTALYETTVPIDISGSNSGTYGIAPGPANLSVFGPDGFYNNGDKYSVRKLADRVTDNPDYVGPGSTKTRKGYDFLVNIPASYRSANSNAYFQVFDPDCYNANGTEADGVTNVDEMRKSDGNAGTTDTVNGVSKTTATTTQYTLYRDNGTPSDPTDDVQLSQTSFGGSSAADKAADMKWNDLYSGNPNYLGTGENLRLNVTSTDGSSENGFSIRVNNKPASSLLPFDSNNGTSVKADGYLPINFNIGGTVTMGLGYVPINAAKSQLAISKFDTDVQNGNRANTINYFCDPPPSNQPAGGFVGVLAGQGEDKTDVISLPADYQGGKWSAVYSAGAQDTSVWSLAYSGAGPGRPGRIKLIR